MPDDDPEARPPRSLRGRLTSAVAAATVGVATNVVSSAVAEPPWWAAVLIFAGSVGLVLGADELLARRRPRGGGVREPVARLRGAVRDQWMAEANRLGVTGQRRLKLRLSNAETAPTLFDVTRLPRRPRVGGAGLAQLWRDEGKLVLLGDQGAGKSELLIAMMVELLGQQVPEDQVPVLIPLASWDATETELYDWLEQWLVASYAFLAERSAAGDPTLARTLLEDDQIAYVLDGFDELPAGTRRVALAKLVGEARRPRRLLLTSRTEAYREAAVMRGQAPLPFPGAVGVRVAPLEPEAVVSYLEEGAADRTHWRPFAGVLERAEALRAVFRTPLMVMLADTIYNPEPRKVTPAVEQLATLPPDEVRRLLFDRFLPVKYGAERAERARRWLRELVPAPATTEDIAWWRLALPPRPRGPARLAARAAGGAAMFLWTAVSAGLLNTWVFNDLATGVTDALRIGSATAMCYVVLLVLTDSGRAAFAAALGAYISGVISGGYELAVVAGLAAGFSWRPLRLARTGFRYAAAAGVIAALIPALVRLAEDHELLALESSMTEGFGAGFADGWVSGWDQDVNGTVAIAVVVALTTALGMRFAPAAGTVRPHPRLTPLALAALVGVPVWVINSFADAERPRLSHGYLLAPAEGLAVGLAVWIVATIIIGAPVRSRPGAAVAVALAVGVCSGIGNTAKGDVTDGWARGLADAVTAGIVVWSLLKCRSAHRPPDKPRNWTVALFARLALPALAVGGAVGACYGISAPWGPAVAYGAAVAAIVLSRPWWPAWRVAADDAAAGGPLPPVAAGLVTLVVVGSFTGPPYGLIVGLLVGLSSKIVAEIAHRSLPALALRPSMAGIAGGLVLGGTVAAAASVTGIDIRWLPLIGVSAGLAVSLAFGTQGLARPDSVMSPRRLLARDRGVFLRTTVVVAAAIAIAVGVRTNAGGQSGTTAATAAFTTLCTYGLTAGLTVAAAQSRSVAYAVELAFLATHGRLPWRLMRFLDDAYGRGVLRQYGPVYRLRHQELAKHLAAADQKRPD